MRKKIQFHFEPPQMDPIPFPGWAFVAAMVVYNELMLHFWSLEELHMGRLAAVLAFALGFGALFGLAVSLVPRSWSKKAAVVLSTVVTVVCVTEYFISDAYQVFMTPKTVISGAGGVAQDYFGLVMSLVFRNLWRIGLMVLPIVLYGLFCRSLRNSWQQSLCLTLAAAMFLVLGVRIVHDRTKDADKFTKAYNFDSAVRSFGMNVALTLEAVNSGGEDEAPSFVVVEPAMPQWEETEAPAGTEAAETAVPAAQTEPMTETEAPAATTEPAVVTEPAVETEASVVTEPLQETAPVSTTEPVQETEAAEVPTEPQKPAAPKPAATGADNVIAALDFAALSQSESNKKVAAVHSYVASLTPSPKNEYTGLFAGKNLILITAEAFSAEVIDPERTPTLYRLANKGIRFEEYYQPAWGASTTSGEFSNVIGLVPTTGGLCMKEPVHQDLFLTMGHQLQELGYWSAAYHNHNKDFYDRHKTHEKLGYDRFIAQYGGLEGVDPVWPESDVQMIQSTVDDYIDQERFSVYYMTVSGHCVYSENGNAQGRKHYDKVADLPYSETVKYYLASQLELEYALEELVAQLEAKGIVDDTVIVISTDHYPYGLERSGTWKNTSDYLRELYGVASYDNFVRDHNALIIWSGCLEDKNIVVEEPVYSLDILPTLSNLFGVEYDSRLLVGRDVFSDAEPLVLWPDYSWKTDKGTFDIKTGEFTPNEGVTVPEGYVAYISSLVANKITYSDSVLKLDYFNYLAKELGRK